MVIKKITPQYKTIKVGGREMRVPLQPSSSTSNLQTWGEAQTQTKDKGDGKLCFLLGGGFSPIGILIAAIIAKREGVVSALWGFLAFWGLFLLIYTCS